MTIADYFAFQGGLPPHWFDGRGLYFVFTKLPATPVPGRDPSIATLAIGALGYALGPDVYIQDMLGLADAFGAHLLLAHRTWLVGHEKPMPAPWVVAKLALPGSAITAEELSTHDKFIFPIDDPDGQPFEDRVADARFALECGAIRELQDAIASPLTPKRFLANVIAAPRLWSLRVPPEPRDARAAFCETSAAPRS